MSSETVDGTVDADRDDGGRNRRPGLLAVFSGDRTVRVPIPVPIAGAARTLGRDTEGAAALTDERLSRQHASVARDRDGWTVRDLDSKNGTFVDGEPIEGEVRVASFRVLRIGNTVLVPSADVERAGAAVDDAGRVVGGALRDAHAAVKRAAEKHRTVLIRGETGTGKELAARLFHQHGPCASGPFVAVNCAAIPEGLAERLLFGAKRGAYSGASADAQGYVQAAHGGVLFLDEAGELDLGIQAKLLRMLESSEVMALGAARAVPVDVRVCVATHRDLRAAVAENRFRADLYHRIAPPEIVLPRLADRADEIAEHVARAVASVSPELRAHATLVEACLLREWPGNVRELHKHVQAAASAAEGSDAVRRKHLAEEAGRAFATLPSTPAPPGDKSARGYVRWSQALDRATLVRALAEHGSIAEAARALGMQRTQMYREMSRLAVEPPKGER